MPELYNNARKILYDIIEDFSPDKFIRFFREKNRVFAPRKEDLFQYYDDNFRSGIKLGEIQFAEDEKMLVCAFEASKPLSERSGKKAQYEKGKKILKESQSDAGILIFYDPQGNFRFSLIYANYLGTRRDWSAFRRFTYFVSPSEKNKTFLHRIGEGDFSSLEKIKDAFSVEKVTKEFYTEIANWYFWAVKNMGFPKDAEKEEHGRNIAVIRMITRLIFIWFMKERGLVQQNLFNYKNILTLLKDLSHENTTYYKAILQNLFFATLNTKIEDRKFRSENRGYKGYNPDFGNHSVYRYYNLFKNPVDIERYFGRIPFLNGGLFECLDYKSRLKEERVYIDGFTDAKKHQPEVPNELFFSSDKEVDLNEEYGTKNKSYKVRGIIDILSSYNFTIDENEPDDQEVALDPELLGRIFENLLASFNPETASTARKATGSYYTPREIVNYMVTQSLVEYFKTHFSGEPDIDKKLSQLFSKESVDNSFDKTTTQKMIQLIESLRIVDPAVGSGAFPMGILNKLVFILSKLDPDNILWKQAQINAVRQNVKDPVSQQRLTEQIEKQFKDKNADYGRKLYLIEKCIYGVDIQQIAVEIAKLRFFISLLVDEKIDFNKPNANIEPLPNLEFKIMQGNSLISTFAEIDFDNLSNLQYSLGSEAGTFISQFEEVKNQYQNEPDKDKKDTLRKQIEDLLIKIFEERLKGFDFKRDIKEPEKDLITYTEGRKPKDFFLWNLYFAEVFQEKGGFDVVIANPPYVKEYTNRTAFDGLRDSSYYHGKMDIWYLFACKGIDLLRNNTGILTFIAQNNWVTSYGASKMRNKVIQDTRIINLVDFCDYKIFESAGIQTMIMIFQRDSKGDNYSFDYRRLTEKDTNFEDMLNLLYKGTTSKSEFLKPTIQRKNFLDKTFTFSHSDNENILNKISQQGNFKLTGNEVAQGIVFPQDFVNKESQKILGDEFNIGDGIFVLSEKEKDSIPFTKEELELIKPSYTTKELGRYGADKHNSEWVIYTDSRFKYPKNIKPYPNIKVHLDKFKKVITSDNKPYGLHRSRNEKFFRSEKIIAVRKCIEPTFTYTDFDCYVSATFYVIKSERINLKYLTALLNSKLIAFWLKYKGKMQGNNYQIDKEPLLAIPIHKPSDKNKQPFITLITQILAAKQKDPNADTSALEGQIDQMVYNLYGLTEDEIKIVEGKG